MNVKKTICFSLMLLFIESSNLFSQTTQDSVLTKVYHRVRPIFSITLGKSNSRIIKNDPISAIYKDSLFDVRNLSSFSNYQLGGGFEADLNKIVLLRMKVIPCGQTISILYKTTNGDEKLNLYFSSFEIPTHLIVQTNEEKYRGYLGGGPTLNLAFPPYDMTKEKFNYRRLDVCAELGIGIIRKFTYLSINPEIRFSQGLMNINGSNKTFYTERINKIYRQVVWFSLNLIAN